VHSGHEGKGGAAFFALGKMDEIKRTPSIERSTSRRDYVWDESPFHCSAEWHLQGMTSRLAPALYSWAWKLSKKSGVFSPSAENVAMYFGVHRNTVQRALEELANVGFLEVWQVEQFKPNVYHIVDHKEWAKRHPGQCVKKSSFPWEGEGDPLGTELHAISGQRVKLLPNQTVALRKFGLSDDEVKAEFHTFLDESSYEGKRWKYAYYDFLKHLRARTGPHAKSPPAGAAVNPINSSGSTVHHARCTNDAPRSVHEPYTTGGR
jgi:hypothetical protein